MIKLLFEAYNDNDCPVYSDEQGAYYTEVAIGGGKTALHRNIPSNVFEGALGEQVDGDYEIYDEGTVCDICESFVGCMYIGDLGYDYTYACDYCNTNELAGNTKSVRQLTESHVKKQTCFHEFRNKIIRKE